MSYESENSSNKQTVLRKLSVELHRRTYCTQENIVQKRKEVAGANICVINSLVLPSLRESQSLTNSLKREQQIIESVDQMKKICEQFQ